MASISKLIPEEPILDRHQRAVEFMDKLFPYYVGNFDIYDAVDNSDLSEEDKKLAKRLNYDIIDLLLRHYHYIDEPGNRCQFHLSYTGQLAQRKGGHFKYLEYLDELHNPKPPISNHVSIGGNNFGILSQAGKESKLVDNLGHSRVMLPNQNLGKSTFSKVITFAWENIWKILTGVATAYIVYLLGFKK